MEGTRTIDQYRQVLTAARDALAGLGGALHETYNHELAGLLEEIDAVAALASGARAETVLETARRGVDGDAGATTYAWIAEHAPSLRNNGGNQLAKIVIETEKCSAITAGVDYDDQDSRVDADAPIAVIWDKVRTGEATPALGLACLREMDAWSERLMPGVVGDVTRAMMQVGIQWGASSMRDLKAAMLARYGLPDEDELERDQEKLRKHAFLSAPNIESADITRYTLGLTPEMAAVLEAALGPLAKPQPNPETGEADLRSNGQRRAEALMEICSRSAAADAEHKGGPAESDACVHVSVSVEDLERRAGAGTVLGSTAMDTHLGIETLRKLCCDADLIPVVLGTDSEALDHGMTLRLFNRAQRRAIWRRDRRCTFPGCTAPAAWTRVHHVRHWADRGPTDVGNAALLCQRHHTFVHDRRLWAEVRSRPDEDGRYVVWDLTPGSYDRELQRRRAGPPRTVA